MSIIGTGIDLVAIARVEGALKKFGERFLTRVFTDSEVAYAQSMKFPARHLAARFAAKEAVSKALRTGIGSACGWKDIEIFRMDTDLPRAILHGAGKETASGLGVRRIHISLTHTKTHAAAVAILES